MKTIILNAVMTVAALCCSAESLAAELRSVVIERIDGTTIAVAMEQGMKASFSHGVMELSCIRGIMDFPLSELRNWRFAETEGENDLWVSAGIDSVIDDPEMFEIEWRDDGIRLSKLPADSKIRVIDMDGRELKSYKAECDFTLSYSCVNPGIYLLVVNGHALKIGVR